MITTTIEPTTPAYWAARIVANHPELATPVARALELVEAGHVRGRDVDSQSGSGSYELTPDGKGNWLCNCPAFVYRPLIIGRSHHCKHTLARAISDRAGLQQSQRRTMKVEAIFIERSRYAWGEHVTEQPVAWLLDGDEEIKREISREEYDALRETATDDDYRDGDYISFSTRSIEWHDVFAEDRVP